MKTKQIFWGFYFLTLGVLFLLAQTYTLEISENFLWDSWPLLLILIGILVMVKTETLKTVFTILLSLFFALLTFGFFQNIFGTDEDSDWDYLEEDTSLVQYYNYKPSYEIANLNFTAAWGKIDLTSETDYLWKVTYNKNYPDVVTNTDVNGNTVNSDIVFKKEGWKIWEKKENRFNIFLNPNPVWNLNFKLGAVESDLHLEQFKIKNLTIKTGASDVTIYLGKKYDRTNLVINSGAADVELYIPQSAGCKVKSKSFLVEKHLPNFKKDADGNFVNRNFATAQNKIIVTLRSAAMNFEIKYY